jgi:hypothetical protein
VLKNKYFGWQLNVVRIIERDLTSLEKEENGMTSLLSRTDADRIGEILLNRIDIDIGKDRLLLNYDLTQNNDSYTLGNGPGLQLMMPQ